MSYLLKWLRQKFEFSQRQARGFLVLMIITMIIASFPFLIDIIPFSKDTSVQDQRMLDSIMASIHLEPKPMNTDSSLDQKRKSSFSKPKNSLKFHLNTVTAQELTKVKGIGNKLSSRIIKYRKILGGYVSSNQLYEVYFLDSAVVDRVKKHHLVTEQKLVPFKYIDLNNGSYKQIVKHPYFNKKLTAYICEVRDTIKIDGETIHDILGKYHEKYSPYIASYIK